MVSLDRWQRAQQYERNYWSSLAGRIAEGSTSQLDWYRWRAEQLVRRLRAAHGRLYEHLRDSVPYWPEGVEGLQPLYQAVVHGCLAGRAAETCDQVYRDRILRGTSGPYAFYSTNILGLTGANLAAVRCFFTVPWKQLTADLTAADQAWLLGDAAFSLRALGRLDEAREPMRASLEGAVALEAVQHRLLVGPHPHGDDQPTRGEASHDGEPEPARALRGCGGFGQPYRQVF